MFQQSLSTNHQGCCPTLWSPQWEFLKHIFSTRFCCGEVKAEEMTMSLSSGLKGVLEAFPYTESPSSEVWSKEGSLALRTDQLSRGRPSTLCMVGSHRKHRSLQEPEKRDVFIKNLYYLISVYNKYWKRLFNEDFLSLFKSFKLSEEKLLKSSLGQESYTIFKTWY